MSPDEVTDAMNSPLTDAEFDQAMGYNAAPAMTSPAPSLPAPTLPNVIPTSSTPTTALTSTSSPAGILTSLWSTITGNIENGVFVILGLLLIAAGIFSFKTSQTIVQTVGNVAKKGAEGAAVIAA